MLLVRSIYVKNINSHLLLAAELSASMTSSLSVRRNATCQSAGEKVDRKLWTSFEHELLRDHYAREHDEYLATR